MFAKVNSMGMQGFEALPVIVEADLSTGLPRFDLVGLPEASVSESRERVRSALKNAGLDFPVSRITVNLAPAAFRKEGPIYDLPILLAILMASRQLRIDLSDSVVLGELSLDGQLRRINGVLPMLISAAEHGIKKAFLPAENAAEASVVAGLEVYPIESLAQLLSHFKEEAPIIPLPPSGFHPGDVLPNWKSSDSIDFSDIRGQAGAKRALEIAAAGGHNVLLVGPPGSGKSMMAKALPSILPSQTYEECLETSKIYSVAGLLSAEEGLITGRPFRAPHHTATPAALTGGGNRTRPGEVSLANNGVLFLDELPLFSRHVLECLRQPLEDHKITISRQKYTATYPCTFMLVCAMNPCPCGYLGDSRRPCSCSPTMKQNYISRVSGPLLDRIDIQIRVQPVPWEDFKKKESTGMTESSADIRARVERAREIQRQRFFGTGIFSNSGIPGSKVRDYCHLTPEAEQTLGLAFDRLGLSARGSDKVLRTARTIADLADAEQVDVIHLSEAISYRSGEDLF